MEFEVIVKKTAPRMEPPATLTIPNSALEPGVEFYQPEDVMKVLRPYFNTFGTLIQVSENHIDLTDIDGGVLVRLTKVNAENNQE